MRDASLVSSMRQSLVDKVELVRRTDHYYFDDHSDDYDFDDHSDDCDFDDHD